MNHRNYQDELKELSGLWEETEHDEVPDGDCEMFCNRDFIGKDQNDNLAYFTVWEMTNHTVANIWIRFPIRGNMLWMLKKLFKIADIKLSKLDMLTQGNHLKGKIVLWKKETVEKESRGDPDKMISFPQWSPLSLIS